MKNPALLVCALLVACGDPTVDTTGGTKTTDATDSNSNTSDPQTSTSTSGSSGGPSGDATGTSGGGETGCLFLCDPDGGPGEEQCDVWAQDCPEGQKCAPASLDGDNSWESTVCVDVGPTPGKPGDECTAEGITGVDTCEVGAMCWNVSADTGKGTCVEQCKGTEQSPSCTDPATLCVIANEGVLTLCLPKCDPLTQDCPNLDLCLPNPQGSAGFACILDASGMEGQEWDPCGYANACDPGLTCNDPALASECDQSAQGCCLPFCDTTVMPPMCNGQGQECIPFFAADQAPPGLESVGLCGIPM